MTKILNIAKKEKLKLLKIAQRFRLFYKKKHVGHFGDISIFSFWQ